MVLLRMGGVYADIDVECQQPLDGLIQPTDTLIVGWEQEVTSARAAAAGAAAADGAYSISSSSSSSQQLARTRQILQWFFAAAPGHPVLKVICDHIARNAMVTFSHNSVRDTQERTGEGVWTDVVLKHALQHPVTKVRVLEQRQAATDPPSSQEGMWPACTCQRGRH
jgi:mannosyltransferase OCH1-like enzyme